MLFSFFTMPRRPSKKAAGKPRPVNRGDAKINKWNKTSDIPLDEEDECQPVVFVLRLKLNLYAVHASRDKILLEGNEYGGDDDGDDDEVFALDLSDNEEEVEDEEEAEDDDEEVPVAKSKSSKSKSKAKTKAKAKTSSEEEESDEDEAWGRGRSAYYSSNAAQLDSDDEEGNELEEQEAKRLQAKSRDAMADDDFGLGDAVEVIAMYLFFPCLPCVPPSNVQQRCA